MNNVMQFRGEYAFLSNFAKTPVKYDGVVYPTVENAFQAAKCLDTSERVPFESCSPKDAKRLGRRVKLRADWEQVKLDIMYELVRDKFARNPRLAERLVATGDAELVEGNAWGDTFWGICRRRGQNHLGRILMRIRGELQ